MHKRIQHKIKKVIWDNDNTNLFILFLGTLVVVYFIPFVFLKKTLFLALLPIIYKTKKDYFWLAWLFILFDAPGYLFKGGSIDDAERIPAYTLVSSISISFYELVIFTYFLKTILQKKRKGLFLFNKESQFFLLLIFLYLTYSIIGYNFDAITIFRSLAPWFFVFIIIHYLGSDIGSLDKFNKLIFPFIFIYFITQIYSILVGEQFVNLFKETQLIKSHLSKEDFTHAPFRSLSGVFFSIYVVTMALYYRFKKFPIYPRYYLDLIISVCLINSFLTGTRGFFLSVLIIIILAYLSNNKLKQILKFSGVIISAIVLVLVFSSLFPKFEKQFKAASNRQSTILLLAEGDVTAGGTLRRLDHRGPQVMKKVEENPLLGFGFSNDFYNNAQGDVGFHSLILQVGYLGLITLYTLLFFVLFKIRSIAKSIKYKQLYNKSGYVFAFAILAIIFYHNTTHMSFGLSPGVGGNVYEVFFVYGLILVSFSNTYYAMLMKNNIISKKISIKDNTLQF